MLTTVFQIIFEVWWYAPIWTQLDRNWTKVWKHLAEMHAWTEMFILNNSVGKRVLKWISRSQTLSAPKQYEGSSTSRLFLLQGFWGISIFVFIPCISFHITHANAINRHTRAMSTFYQNQAVVKSECETMLCFLLTDDSRKYSVMELTKLLITYS